ncbi:MAG: MFS transporter [Planctomycetia bacterium]|nr:MFS transporter [Planctomycetia bacterium]
MKSSTALRQDVANHSDQPAPELPDDNRPWYRLLNAYQWIVLIVCSLGWAFDTLDQQIFALSRSPAIAELLKLPESSAMVSSWSGWATSLMLIGWATGGIIFGVLGDKLGRIKVMICTIAFYSLSTGFTGLAHSLGAFLALRFVVGLGIGGAFTVCATMVAETMPSKARPMALGFLQAMSAVSNIAAAFITLGIGELVKNDWLPFGWSTWRWSFMIGVFPVVLLFFIMKYLKEPETWTKAHEAEKAGGKKAGSLLELFSDPLIRKRIILGMLLSMVGVIGFWGIMLFAIDLNRSVFRKIGEKTAIARQQGADVDRAFLIPLMNDPAFAVESQKNHVSPDSFLSQNVLAADGTTELNFSPRDAFRQIQRLGQEGTLTVTATDLAASLLNESKRKASSQRLDHSPSAPGQEPAFVPYDQLPAQDKAQADAIAAWFTAPIDSSDSSCEKLWKPIDERKKEVDRIVNRWGSLTSILINAGGFLGMFSFAFITCYLGRRITFTIFLSLSTLSILLVFLAMDQTWEILTFIPFMGFSICSLMGGYTIYFPELFPTRLRSTSVSFCYNVGRYLAAVGPSLLGGLTIIFQGCDEPIRYAGASLCPIFLLGILIVWFLPETKDKPLPE